MNTVVLIPSYNPSEALLKLLRELSEKEQRILVVNDGSDESYTDIFKEAEQYATVLHQHPNGGKGTALKAGIRYVKDHLPECNAIVTADADGQHKVADILAISETLHEKGGFVIGTRKFTGKVPFRSRFGNALTKLVFLVAAGKKCSDTQTGLRGFTRDLFDFMLNVKGNRYEYEMNVMMQTAQGGIAIHEVPIETVYENDNSSSHFHPIRDSYRIYKTIFINSTLIRYGLSAVFCFLLDFSALALFETFIPLIAISTLLARCISSPINYLINRIFVFKSNANKAASFISYIVLAGCVILAKMALMTLLNEVLGVHYVIANISVEVVLFITNFIIQKLFIFKNKKEN
ncbi:MAG: bifunctional glycosyltransferase family 2/GtrA family protein [Clostridia bacterium]|nr:bifunctional glycosyltransferase family 2/GtrA family protein [Clostridia bacterium]